MTEYGMNTLRKIIASGVPRLIQEEVAGEDVRNTMIDAGFGSDDEEVEELLTLGYLLAYKGLDRLAEINSDRYRCRSCGADFGLELPFPESNPTCGEETEEGSCDNGLITRPSDDEDLTVWAVVTRAGGTSHGLWYYKAQEARAHVQADVAGEMPDHVALYRIKIPTTVENEDWVEILVNSVLEKMIPSGMRVTLGFMALDVPHNQSPIDPKVAAAMKNL